MDLDTFMTVLYCLIDDWSAKNQNCGKLDEA